jgi:hypothetical protein
LREVSRESEYDEMRFLSASVPCQPTVEAFRPSIAPGSTEFSSTDGGRLDRCSCAKPFNGKSSLYKRLKHSFNSKSSKRGENSLGGRYFSVTPPYSVRNRN